MRARPLPCLVRQRRKAMTDDQFWDDVSEMLGAGRPPVAPDEDDPGLDVVMSTEPCPVCGSNGACGYDSEGRPMIHTDTELPDE